MKKRLLNSQGTLISRLSKNYLVLSGAEFISKALTAVAFAYLARIFGPSTYGQLEFSLAIFFLFTLIVDSGLGSLGAREIAKNWENFDSLFGSITTLRILLAVIAFIFMNAFALLPKIDPSVRILIFYYSLTLFGLPWLIQWVFQGRDWMKAIAIASLIRWIIFFGGVFLIVNDASEIWAVPVIEGAAIITAGIYLNSLLIRRSGKHYWRINFRDLLSVWKQALPIGASEIVWAFRVYFATVALGLYIGGVQLGWFTSAHRIVIAMHGFVWLYFYNLLPSIARSSRLPLDHVQRLLRLSMQITAWSGVYFAVLASAFATTIVSLFYGREFVEAGGVFKVLVWMLPLALISGHYRFLLIGYSQQLLEFFCSVVGVIITVLLNVILIPRMNEIGAAWSLVIAEAVIWIMAYRMVKSKIGMIPFLPEIWRPLVGGALMMAILIGLPFSNWLSGIVATLAFGGVLIISSPNMIAQIRSLASGGVVV